MALKGTTRAYKRIKNGMFWSEIASRFQKRNVTHPPTIPRTALPPPPTTPPVRVQSRPLFNILFATHARINEIKTNTHQLPYISPSSLADLLYFLQELEEKACAV